MVGRESIDSGLASLFDRTPMEDNQGFVSGLSCNIGDVWNFQSKEKMDES